MNLQSKTVEELVRLLQESRSDRRRLQKLEHAIASEINSRSGLITPEYSRTNGLKTGETIAVANFARTAHMPNEWVDFIENMLEKRKHWTTSENESTI